MRTPQQLQEEYDNLDIKPDEVGWMIEQLTVDVQGASIQPEVYVAILEAHIETMLTQVIAIMMEGAEPSVVQKAVAEFAQFSKFDKLSRIHNTLLQQRLGKKLYIPKGQS